MRKLLKAAITANFSLLGIAAAAAQPSCSEAQVRSAIETLPEFSTPQEISAFLSERPFPSECGDGVFIASSGTRAQTQTASAALSPPELFVAAVVNVRDNHVPAVPGLFQLDLLSARPQSLGQSTVIVAARWPSGRYTISFSSSPEGAQIEYAGTIRGTTRMEALLSESALGQVRLVMEGYHPCSRNEAQYEGGRFHCEMRAVE